MISKTKTKESNAKSGWARPTQLKKWVGHWPTWPTRFLRHWVLDSRPVFISTFPCLGLIFVLSYSQILWDFYFCAWFWSPTNACFYTVHMGELTYQARDCRHRGPVHICSRYTTPAKCSQNKFKNKNERSDCEHCEMFLARAAERGGGGGP